MARLLHDRTSFVYRYMAAANYERNDSGCSNNHADVTPSDTISFEKIPRALRIGVAGNVTIEDKDGTSVTYAVASGEVLSFSPTRVMATGTTATGIVAWW